MKIQLLLFKTLFVVWIPPVIHHYAHNRVKDERFSCSIAEPVTEFNF